MKKGNNPLSMMAVLLIIILALDTSSAFAHGYKVKEVSIGHIWAKPSDGAGIAVYGPLLNKSTEIDYLISAETPIAKNVSIQMKDGSLKDISDTLTLKSGKPFSLAPWHEHLWLSGLEQEIKEGDTFPLTLTFANAGAIEVKVVVEKQANH